MAAKRPAKVPAAPAVRIETIPISRITLDPSLQMRVETSEEIISQYAEAIADGIAFPPVTVFRIDGDPYLVDGWHRFFATDRAGLREITCEVREGDRYDAKLFAVGTNADKRKAVEAILLDPVLLVDRETGATRSNVEIARRCGVNEWLVRKMRAEIDVSSGAPKIAAPEVRTVTRNGATYQQNVARIGKKPEPAALPLLGVEPAAPPSPSPSLVPPPADEPVPEETGNVIHLGARLERMPTERELEREAEAEQAKQEVLDDYAEFDETNPTSRARVVFHAINLINGVRLQSGDYWGYFKFGPHGPSFAADAKFARETLDLLIHEYEANERRRK